MAGLKVLMVNYEFPPMGGGAGKAHLELLKQFSKEADLEIDVLTSSPYPGKSLEQMADNIRIYKVGVHKKELHYWRKIEIIEWLFKAGFEYRKLIRENEYDFAHAFFGFPTGWLCYRNRKKLPYMISLRGSDVPGGNARLKIDYKILGPVFKRIWKNASKLVANSDGLKQRALNFYPSATIDIIVNGVDTEAFYPANVERGNDEFKLVTVGRLSLTKRIDMLIEAVEILLKAGAKIKLLVVGEGAQQQRLRKIAVDKGLESQIEFAGRLEPEQLPKVYRGSDIYVSATMQEGMSNSMLEAMASGLPIVTTKCEGLEEIIDGNGIVVETDNAQAIAGAVKTLIDDKQVYKKMLEAVIKRTELFSWEKVGQDYMERYKQLITGQE